MKIIYCQQSVVAEKDFAEEVRALLDVRKFVSDSFILTDIQEVRIKLIVDQIIDRLAKSRQLERNVADEAKSQLFVERNSLSMVLANTMQGIYKSRSDGRIAYDHSWLVVTCSLTRLHKRQVAIARFAQPINFGRQSQEVRFLIIVLAPSKEKLTKSAWETGRTFATMFTDINFRQRMLKAKNQEEIKLELLLRAEDLARHSAQSRNNSIYDLSPQQVDLGQVVGSEAGVGGVGVGDLECQICMRNDSLPTTTLEPLGTSLKSSQQARLGSLEFFDTSSFLQNELKHHNHHHHHHRHSQSFHHHHNNNHNHHQDNISTQQQYLNQNNNTLIDDIVLAKRQQLQQQRQPSYSAKKRPSNDSSSTDASGKTAASSSNGGKSAKNGGESSCCLSGCWPQDPLKSLGRLGQGLADDLRRRSRVYMSDFTDGFVGERSLYKTISTTIFLYFSVLLPCIAFGVVDTNNTDGAIDPKKTMIGQALGGLFFALFSGQPLVVVMTTAPLCIYIKVIYQVSQDLEVSFASFYAVVGLWMAFFLVLMSVTNSSNLMKHCTRSTEDIFALFTAFAFGSDGIRESIRSFQKYYWEPDCLVGGSSSTSSSSGVGASANHAPQHHSLAHILVAQTAASTAAAAGLHQQLHNVDQLATNFTATAARSGSAGSGSAAGGHLVATLLSAASAPDTHTLALPGEYLHHVVDSPAPATVAASSGHNADPSLAAIGASSFSLVDQVSRCQRETCILFLFLMCGTLWLANSFSSFNRTPYLSARKREVIKDYALAIAVLIFSFIGSYLFSDIRLDVFEFSEFTGLHVVQLGALSPLVCATGALLGFMASVLFYIDQNICSAMVNNAPYKLKKGNYFHLDLFVLAILNIFLSLTGLPWMHGKLPHSHLHSKALADYEERVDEGHIHQIIVNIRETRLTGILTSMLIALSLLAVPYPLSYIPLPVLSGVFLYTALAEFKSNSMVERVCLLFTEQAAYPPNHYIRRCPQRKIHLFTLAQLVQLAIVSFIGFYPNPYVNMAFPLAVATFVPVRRLLLPKMFERKHLRSLDSPSLE